MKKNFKHLDELIKEYKKLITWSTHIYFVSPVWWFRLTPKMETFFDEVLTPGFAYNFVHVVGKYAFPKPKLSDKKVRTYITHGKTKQFWSVPFVDAKKRAKYLSTVKKDIRRDLELN